MRSFVGNGRVELSKEPKGFVIMDALMVLHAVRGVPFVVHWPLQRKPLVLSQMELSRIYIMAKCIGHQKTRVRISIKSK